MIQVYDFRKSKKKLLKIISRDVWTDDMNFNDNDYAWNFKDSFMT